MGRLVFGSLSYWNSVHFQSVFIHSQTSPKEGKYAFSVSVSLTNAFGIKSLQHRAAYISTWDLRALLCSGLGGDLCMEQQLHSGCVWRGDLPPVVPMPKPMPRLELWLPQQGWDCAVCGSRVLSVEPPWVTVRWALLQSEPVALAWAGRAWRPLRKWWSVAFGLWQSAFPGADHPGGTPEL